MKGKEIIKWIQENNAEEVKVYFQPDRGRAYKDVTSIDFEIIRWSEEVIAIKGRN